ncbi:hypothetical protein GCM10009836_39530 [Pseudonocardia ailaonensis]|uniref:Uncharacterized protein n=2 Tax=Pseudonocardia ailaonensis TaxID=367279 RepID=A0ABN2N8E7_9PSEU
MPGRRRAAVIGAVAVAAATALAGCSTAAPGGGAAPASAAPAAAAAAGPGGGKDTAAACTAQVQLDSSLPPGADPDGPTPSADEMKAWAATVAGPLATVQRNAPDSLAAPLKVYADQLAQAQQGKPLDGSDPQSSAATNTLDQWVHDSCGFQTLDVTNDGGTLGPVTAALKPGPVAVRFTNAGDPGKAGFVLLVARVKDGQSATPQQVDSGTDIEQVADVAAGALPSGPGPAYAVATLKPGNYLVSAVLGTPPTFAGSTSAAFTVS